MTNRGERRAQKRKNAERWRRIFSATHIGSAASLERNVRAAAAHGSLCSCPVCGNPRRWFGALTVQELRAEQRAAVDLRSL